VDRKPRRCIDFKDRIHTLIFATVRIIEKDDFRNGERYERPQSEDLEEDLPHLDPPTRNTESVPQIECTESGQNHEQGEWITPE
jgi:hypothetical protein